MLGFQDVINRDLPNAVRLLNSLTEQVCNSIKPDYFDASQLFSDIFLKTM